MRNTDSVRRVAAILLDNTTSKHYGYDLMKRARLRSGTLYPILQRFLDEGWVADGWESSAHVRGPRPLRRYYKLTKLGRRQLAAFLTADFKP
jgi:DNA-binding PadR family transcriptional regulator